jgi:hypothetical protein
MWLTLKRGKHNAPLTAPQYNEGAREHNKAHTAGLPQH